MEMYLLCQDSRRTKNIPSDAEDVMRDGSGRSD